MVNLFNPIARLAFPDFKFQISTVLSLALSGVLSWRWTYSSWISVCSVGVSVLVRTFFVSWQGDCLAALGMNYCRPVASQRQKSLKQMKSILSIISFGLAATTFVAVAQESTSPDTSGAGKQSEPVATVVANGTTTADAPASATAAADKPADTQSAPAAPAGTDSSTATAAPAAAAPATTPEAAATATPATAAGEVAANAPATNAPATTDAAATAAGTNAPTAATPAQGGVIPLIVMDDVPLTDAIKNLARQAGLNYLLDPKIGFGQPSPDGKPTPQPTVSIRWENVSAEQALNALLGNYNLQLAQDPNSKIARVTVRDPAAPDPLVTKVIQL